MKQIIVLSCFLLLTGCDLLSVDDDPILEELGNSEIDQDLSSLDDQESISDEQVDEDLVIEYLQDNQNSNDDTMTISNTDNLSITNGEENELVNQVVRISENQFITVNALPEVFSSYQYRLEGKADADVDRIVVEFANPTSVFPKDVFQLKKYEQGSENWYYVADHKYEILDWGLNIYDIKAYKGNLESVTRVLIFNDPRLAFHQKTKLYHQKSDLIFDLYEIEEELTADTILDFILAKYPKAYWHAHKPLNDTRFYFFTLVEDASSSSKYKYYLNFALTLDDRYFFGEILMRSIENVDADKDLETLNQEYRQKAKENAFDQDETIFINRAIDLIKSFQLEAGVQIDLDVVQERYKEAVMNID